MKNSLFFLKNSRNLNQTLKNSKHFLKNSRNVLFIIKNSNKFQNFLKFLAHVNIISKILKLLIIALSIYKKLIKSSKISKTKT